MNTIKQVEREPGCTCNFGTEGNPVFGGYARCIIHDPNMRHFRKGMKELAEALMNSEQNAQVSDTTEDK